MKNKYAKTENKAVNKKVTAKTNEKIWLLLNRI